MRRQAAVDIAAPLEEVGAGGVGVLDGLVSRCRGAGRHEHVGLADVEGIIARRRRPRREYMIGVVGLRFCWAHVNEDGAITDRGRFSTERGKDRAR